jgi:hypothetical protein
MDHEPKVSPPPPANFSATHVLIRSTNTKNVTQDKNNQET